MTQNNNSVTVSRSFPACESDDLSFDVGEGGTTARFLACMLTLGKKHYRLNLGERLSQRPWDEFIDLVNAHGGKASLEGRVLNVQGPLEFESTLNIDCARTSQFASGFLLAYGKGMKIYPQNLRSSESYWEM